VSTKADTANVSDGWIAEVASMRVERHAALMDEAERHRDQAIRAAARAQGLLAQPATLDSYDWLLLATLIVEADDALKTAQRHDPTIHLPILGAVVEELREVTSNFSRPDFLAATKPARRQNPILFDPRR